VAVRAAAQERRVNLTILKVKKVASLQEKERRQVEAVEVERLRRS
jgi:hypothetical protein